MCTSLIVATLLSLSLISTVQCVFNPLELYVGASEGFALSHVDTEDKATVYDMFIYQDHHSHLSSGTYFGHHDEELEILQIKTNYNKMKITHRGFRPNTYHVDIHYYDYYAIRHGNSANYRLDRGRLLQSVPLENDGSIALQCVGNKRYLKWDSLIGKSGIQEPCTSLGICDQCKFFPEVGSINPIHIEIVSIDWGDVSDDIVKNPSVLARDQQDNWSDQEVTNTFHISYTDSTEDTTTWENTWGFELSTSVKTTFKISVVSVEVAVTATTTYSGKKGGSSSVTDSTTFEKTASYPCPAKHRCFYNLIGRHMNDQAVPFTATVRKTDGDHVKEWKEDGIWRGVKVYDTWAEFCTEDLETHETNCPHKLRAPLH